MADTNISSEIKTLAFWNHVASEYAKNEMTSRESEEELDHILDYVKNREAIKYMMCVGVADGVRDPEKIFQYFETKKPGAFNGIKRVAVNDYSVEMINLA